ncbi:MAG: hypothetical protein ACHP65_06120 [Legionellales bacterium]
MNTKFLLFFCMLACLPWLCYSGQQLKKKVRIVRWQQALNLQQHHKTFQQLYQDVDGFLLSRQARLRGDALEYVYGEIEFLPFIALLSLTNPNSDTVFYDLGSGTGKAVLAAAMVYPLRKSVGIELHPELYFCACQQAARLTALQTDGAKAASIEFILGDFFEVDLNSATLIFINATALFGQTWVDLCQRLALLPQLQTVITTSKALCSSVFSLTMSTEIQMSWGVVRAFIHTRKTINDELN